MFTEDILICRHGDTALNFNAGLKPFGKVVADGNETALARLGLGRLNLDVTLI